MVELAYVLALVSGMAGVMLGARLAARHCAKPETRDKWERHLCEEEIRNPNQPEFVKQRAREIVAGLDRKEASC